MKFARYLLLAAALIVGLARVSFAEVAVGTFTANTSTGNQSVTGIGFTPDIIFLWSSISTAEGTSSPVDKTFGIGAYDGTSDGADSWAKRIDADLARRRVAGGRVIALNNANGDTLLDADGISLDADGFTLNITVTAGTAYRINYLALTADGAKVNTVTITTGAGTIAVSSVGFQPNCLIVLHTRNEAGGHEQDAVGGIGWTIGTGANDEANYGLSAQQGAKVAKGRHDTDSVLVGLADDAASIVTELSLSSFDGDGYTLNKDTAPGTQYLATVIALKFAQVAVFTNRGSPTGAPNQTDAITGAGFRPDGALSLATFLSSADSITSNVEHGFGAYDGTSEACASLSIVEADSDGGIGQRTTKAIQVIDGGAPTTQLEADGTSLDSDGVTYTWTTTDGTARRYSVLMFDSLTSANSGVFLPLLGVGE